MARLFPEWINDEQRNANPKFRAEFKVYDALARSLSDEWYVFCNRTWTWVENQSHRLRTREVDFLIAHPRYGVLILEVKGGEIKVEQGRWVSKDRYGQEWEINPYDQVSIAATALERWLNEEHDNVFRNYRFSTGVCFPDVDISDYAEHLSPKHRQVTIDARQMTDLRPAIIGLMKDGKGSFDPPGEPRIQALKHLFARSWYIHAPKSIQIEHTETEIKRLTEKQFELLHQLAPAVRRLLVAGCAGSGKTILAAEIARRLVVNEKKRVLFTCYNRNLAIWLRSSSFFVDNGQMMISNYQKLCADFAKGARVSLPKSIRGTFEDRDPVFKEVYPNALLEAAEKAGQQFDAIIVDEGQDFLETWWTPLLLLLKEDGVMHVYYDSYQQLWWEQRSLPAEVTDGARSIDLTVNIRNTRSIHDLAMSFHPSHGAGYTALGEKGIDPEFVPISAGKNEHQVVRDIVEDLIIKEHVRPCEIAILTPLSTVRGRSSWKPGVTLLGKYRLVHQLNPGKNEIFCSSIGAAKGLEFPVTILTELFSPAIQEEISDYVAHLYVGVSRARSHLIVVCDKEDFKKLNQFYRHPPI